MQISLAGIDLVKRSEGLRLTAYRDAAGIWTIGYGHTGGVRDGDTVTAQQADILLSSDIASAEHAVRAQVTVPLSQGQFDALVSWVFNLGAERLRDSTLLRKLNAGDDAGAAAELLRWVHAGGMVLPGLVTRRRAERALFLADSSHVAAPPMAPPVPPPPNAGGPAPAPSAGAHQAPAAPPAPAQENPAMAPFIAAALPAIVAALPELSRMFGSGSEVAERNIKAAETAVRIVQEATGAHNAQDVAERITTDPIAVQSARQALRERWYELEEVAGGIAAARDANAPLPPLPRLGVRFHELLTLLVVTGAYTIGGLYLFTGSPAPEMAAALVTALVISALGGIVAYWFGSTSGSAVKSELLARRP